MTGAQKGVWGAAAAFVAVIVWAIYAPSTGARSNLMTASAPSGATASTPSAPSIAPTAVPTAPCDLSGAWEADVRDDVAELSDEHLGKFRARITAWSQECRMRAIANLCSAGCQVQEAMTDAFIADAPLDEQKLLRKVRLDGNIAELKLTRAYYVRAKAIIDYALSIVGSPRASYYDKPNANFDETVQEIANGNPCRVRMKRDFDRIEDLVNEIEQKRPQMIGMSAAQLEVVLRESKSCLDCSDDRMMCKELRTDLGDVSEILDDGDKFVTKDKKLLAK